MTADFDVDAPGVNTLDVSVASGAFSCAGVTLLSMLFSGKYVERASVTFVNASKLRTTARFTKLDPILVGVGMVMSYVTVCAFTARIAQRSTSAGPKGNCHRTALRVSLPSNVG